MKWSGEGPERRYIICNGTGDKESMALQRNGSSLEPVEYGKRGNAK